MELEQLVGVFHLDDQMAGVREVFDGLPADTPRDWRGLAAVLARRDAGRRREQGTAVLGISGGQGAGKTTLSTLLVRAVETSGRRAVTLSLDDFYLPRAERQALGRRIHPLLATRGVPGTHDVTLALGVIDDIRAGRIVRAPVFDKGTDDRVPDADARRIDPGVDLVIFEGWCLGAPPQPAPLLVEPVNDLERQEDPDGGWRRYVNDALAGDYQRLWRALDELLFLQVPDLVSVVRWRSEQEQQLPLARRMGAEAIGRFVAHYERLTRWMLATLPETADMVGLLDENHGLAALRVQSAGARVPPF